MNRRRIGADGPAVGAVGLGCMSFGGFYGPTDERESHATLKRAIDLGIDHLDTADGYGSGVSEQVIGSFLRQNPSARFHIATKGGIVHKPVRSFNNRPDYLREALEGSLRRLGRDHVELYYIHRRDQSVPVEDVIGTLVRFKEEGKIGAIGLSEISPATLERAQAVHPIAAVQSEYSLWTRLPELGLLQACKRRRTALVAFSPVGRGIFADKLPDPARFREGEFRAANPRFQEPNWSYNARRIAAFNDFAREQGFAPAALAIAWVLSRGEHVIAIPGTRSGDHLEQDAAGASIALTPEMIDRIEELLPVGFAHGDRYSDAQAVGPERYC